MLRGAQTPGEIRSRTNRLCEYADVDEVEAALERLAAYESGPYVARLPREPGKREARWAHLLSGEVEAAPQPQPAAAPPSSAEPTGGPDLDARVTALETELAALRERLARLENG